MRIFKPEGYFNGIETNRLFLAGTIEMGTADDWQSFCASELKGLDNLALFNPRRDDWDSTWIQNPDIGTHFHDQVAWEMYHLKTATDIIFNFLPDSKSPITLLELGLYINTDKQLYVCCPEDFYRHGNVCFVCRMAENVKFFTDLKQLTSTLKHDIRYRNVKGKYIHGITTD